jgi:V/A-type H+-transporting ATPase subunit E
MSKVIVDKIIEEAERTAASILRDANEDAERLLEKTRAEGEERRKSALAEAAREAEELVRNRLTLADLELKREELRARQALIDAAYTAAKRSVMCLAGEGYKDLVRKMLTKYAESGDTVVAGKSDIKKLDAAFIETVARALRIELKLQSAPGDFDGGIKLVNAACDKNLTFDGLLAELRREIDADVVKLIEGAGQ